MLPHPLSPAVRPPRAPNSRHPWAQTAPLDEALAAAEVPEGPLDLATRAADPLPLRVSALRQALEGTNVTALAKVWAAEYAGPTAPLPNFPETVTLPRPCVGGCSADLRLPQHADGSRGALKPVVAQLLEYFQLAIRFASATETVSKTSRSAERHSSGPLA